MLPKLFEHGQLLELKPVYPRYQHRVPSHYAMFSHWAYHPQALDREGKPQPWALRDLNLPMINAWDTGNSVPEVIHMLGLVLDGVIGEYNVNSAGSIPLWGEQIYHDSEICIIIPEWIDRWGTGLVELKPISDTKTIV